MRTVLAESRPPGSSDNQTICRPKLAEETARTFPRAAVLTTLDDLMEVGVEGIVIATPSALHAEEANAALERGKAVICQRPLTRGPADESISAKALESNAGRIVA